MARPAVARPAWLLAAALAVGACTAGTSDSEPFAPGVTAPLGSTTTAPAATVPAATPTAPGAGPVTTTPPSTAGELPLSSSDEQRCAIAAEAAIELEGCPG